MSKKLKILFLSAEVVPFSKTGGLADVAGSLPKALAELGHQVIVVTAKHGIRNPKDFKFKRLDKKIPVKIDSKKIFCYLDRSHLNPKIPIYFIANQRFFNEEKAVYGHDDARRFYLLAKAFLQLPEMIDFKPDIIHCNDWHTGLVPFLLKKRSQSYQWLAKAKTIFTIHNLEYQGDLYWRDLVGEKKDDGYSDLPGFTSQKIQSINFMKRGILSADIANTVSSHYRNEALTPTYGRGLDSTLKSRQKRFYGILNGIDYNYFNPQTDPNIKYNYDWKSFHLKEKNKELLRQELGLDKQSGPLLGMVTRIIEQKGFGLMQKIIYRLLELQPQIAIVGEGDRHYKQFLKNIAKKNPGRIGLHLNFSEELGSRIYAASDIFLMPSLYEPCGLGQMIAMRYGAIPVVRRTGGLFDTVIDYSQDKEKGNGFCFSPFSPSDLLDAVFRALFYYRNKRGEWNNLIRRVMKLRFDWQRSAKSYQKIYRQAIKNNDY